MKREVFSFDAVAPARERGLKLLMHNLLIVGICRSRKGAWIEIRQWAVRCMHEASRSRKGAWIEISVSRLFLIKRFVAPARERGLK